MFKRIQISAKLIPINLVALLLLINGCTSRESQMDSQKLTEFAAKYIKAWCSQNAASAAAFFAENGSLKINDGERQSDERRLPKQHKVS